jgi:wyosine [tRNA(Phe)-imidazoG37] synthetase (radical SAM superfamily)
MVMCGDLMRHVFGPVPSRRLGRSLGIDPTPLKTCNWNCVYCQLGRTTPLTNERRNYIPAAEIVEEVEQALRAHRPGEIDWVTFIGSGEPTLHASLGWMIRKVKTLTSIPVAVVTNGSLLYHPEVREELTVADAVLPSLDAGTASLYRAVNRPHPECSFERLVHGLIDFRASYRGKLWVEVMLVQRLNDTEAALKRVVEVLSQVRPDEIHVSSPVRPPAELWVEPPTEEGLARATAILGETARVVGIAPGCFDLSGFNNVVEAVMAIISRHPMEEGELIRTLHRWAPSQLTETLAELAADGSVQVVNRHGNRFWSSRTARYQQPLPTPKG